MIAYGSVGSAYRGLCGELLKFGEKALGARSETSPGSGRSTVDLRPHAFSVAQPRFRSVDSAARPQSYPFVLGAFLYVLAGRRDVASVEYYNPRATAFTDDGETLRGSYGPSIAAALPRIIDLLRRDPYTRRAVLPIFSLDSLEPSRDVPCPIGGQFLLNAGGGLDLVMTFRSQSVNIFPYDAALFTLIQEHVARQAGLPLGRYHQFTGSMHAYEDELPGVLAVAQEPYLQAAGWPEMPAISELDFAVLLLAESEFRARGEAAEKRVMLFDFARIVELDPYWRAWCAFLQRFAGERRRGKRHLRGAGPIAEAFAAEGL